MDVFIIQMGVTSSTNEVIARLNAVTEGLKAYTNIQNNPGIYFYYTIINSV